MKETALITGASAGIGRDLAHLFAADGSDLILVARREDVLGQLAAELSDRYGVGCRVLPADLAQPSAPGRILDRCRDWGAAVDVVVNNAGFGALGPFSELDEGRQVDLVQVNVMALTHLTRLFLPGMLDRGRGGILNVASTAAFQPGPYMAAYYGSKAFVLSFSESLFEEVRGLGVTVTCLAPGPVATEFQAVAGMEDSGIFRAGVMDSESVARAGYQGFRTGRALVVPGLLSRAGTVAVRFAPRALVRRVTARINTGD
jgi:short-subunit dehydrogenase